MQHRAAAALHSKNIVATPLTSIRRRNGAALPAGQVTAMRTIRPKSHAVE
jgi:hypothetical protein